MGEVLKPISDGQKAERKTLTKGQVRIEAGNVGRKEAWKAI